MSHNIPQIPHMPQSRVLKVTGREDFKDFFEYVENYKKLGQHELAVKELESFLCEELANSYAYEELGDNFLSLRRLDAAEKVLKEAIKLNPVSANAHYLLGFVYGTQTNWTRSVAQLDLANRIEPNHAEILRCLGWSLFHYGEKVQGLAIMYRARNLSSEDVLILTDLGVCLLNNKQFDEAYLIFKKIIAIEPEHEHAIECLRLCKYYLS